MPEVDPLSFRAGLKDPATEELIDLFVHRPLAYLVARVAYPTPLSPDAITIASMLAGIASGLCFYASMATGRSLALLGGVLFIVSAILDCADGQLARMRKRSTRFGRMLDGAVDAVVQLAAVPAMLLYMVWRRGGLGSPGTLGWFLLGLFAIVTGLQHTTLYDQFRMVFVFHTSPAARDCDDVETVEREWRELTAKGPVSFVDRFRFFFYGVHVRGIARVMRLVDPYTPSLFREMTPYSPEGAAVYRERFSGLMRAWSFYGIGTHIFLLGVFAAADRAEYYIALRGLGFNAALVALSLWQRRVSSEFYPRVRLQPTPS